MPALRLLGRNWHIASDDLPLPSFAGAFWHFAISVLNAVDLTYVVESLKPSCKYRSKHLGYLAVHLGCFVLNAVTHTWTYFESRQGSIFQVHCRRRVGPLGVVALILYVLTTANNMYGSHLISHYDGDQGQQCKVASPPLELDHFRLMKVIVIATWASLLVGFIIILIAFNLFSTYGGTSSPWESRCKFCRYACFCCCIGALSKDYSGSSGHHDGHEDKNMSPMLVIANVFTLIFGSVDMTLTDYLAGFTLVGAQHRYRKPALLYRNAPPPKWLDLPPPGPPTGATTPQVTPSTFRLPAVLELAASGRSETSTSAAQEDPDSKRPGLNTSDGPLSSPTPTAARPPLTDDPLSAKAATATTASVPVATSAPPTATADGAALPQPKALDSATPKGPNRDANVSIASDEHILNNVGLGDARSTPIALRGDAPSVPPDEPAVKPPIELPYGRAAFQETWNGSFTDSNVSLEVMEEALHYLKFATAVYGWKMYLWMYRRQVSQCCKLCVGRQCGCCRQSTYFCPVGQDTGPPEAVLLPNRLLEREAITQITGVEDKDILYVNYTNKIGGLLPYYIALDRLRQSVVIGIRGSLSLRDVVTDLLCEPAAYEVPGVPSTDEEGRVVLWAHHGMLKSTLAILKDIRENGILEAVVGMQREAVEGQQQPGLEGTGRLSKRGQSMRRRVGEGFAGWRVVVTGHSLGGGVTGLLGPLLRSQYPNIRCWAFAPPGGLMSPQAAKLTREYCVSVVHAKDMIPRLAVTTTEQLVQELVKACVHCRINKATIMWNMVMLGWRPGADKLFLPNSELTRELKDLLTVYDSSQGTTRCQVGAQFNSARDFVPPGHLLYVERRKRDKEQPPSCSCNICMVDRSLKVCGYACRWIQVPDLMREGLVVSRSMFMDHLPDNTLNAMQEATRQLKEQLQKPKSDFELPQPYPSSLSAPRHKCNAPATKPSYVSIIMPTASPERGDEHPCPETQLPARESEMAGSQEGAEAAAKGGDAGGASPGPGVGDIDGSENT